MLGRMDWSTSAHGIWMLALPILISSCSAERGLVGLGSASVAKQLYVFEGSSSTDPLVTAECLGQLDKAVSPEQFQEFLSNGGSVTNENGDSRFRISGKIVYGFHVCFTKFLVVKDPRSFLENIFAENKQSLEQRIQDLNRASESEKNTRLQLEKTRRQQLDNELDQAY
jgi:hypothetical protein